MQHRVLIIDDNPDDVLITKGDSFKNRPGIRKENLCPLPKTIVADWHPI